MNYTKFFIAILFIGSMSNVSAQKQLLKDQEVALYNYMFALSEEFQYYMEDLIEADPIDAMGVEDEVSDMFAHRTYQIVEQELETYFNCQILPVESMEEKVLYDTRGYPSGGKKNTVASGVASNYFKIAVQITPRDMIDEELSVNGVAMMQRKIKPHIQIKLIAIDSDGNTVVKAKGKAKGDAWVVIDRLTIGDFLSFEGNVVEEQQDTLLGALQSAIDDLKANL